ncbi:MAG: hypothetical protein V7707_20130 [Motiliproteus sp.]
MTLGRIGNSGRTKPAMKYANEAGTCSRPSCNRTLRRATEGFYGKYCNPCSRRLIDHGDFTSDVPTITQQPYAVLYETIIEVATELIRTADGAMGRQAATLERIVEFSKEDGMGDPALAKRSDTWLIHHYYHHQLTTKKRDPIDLLLHMTAVVGMTQLHPQGFATDDQETLFLCKRGLGYKSLPLVRLKADGTPAPHGRFPLRTARVLAKRIKGDWVLTPRMLELVAEQIQIKADAKRAAHTTN